MLIIKKDILDFDKGPADGLDDTTITAEDKYSTNVSKSRNNFFYKSELQ